MAQEKGAFSWLSALPMRRYSFALHMQEWILGRCILCYNWMPDRLPIEFVHGWSFDVSHEMDCHTGGFPTRRHDEIREITACRGEVRGLDLPQCHRRTNPAAPWVVNHSLMQVQTLRMDPNLIYVRTASGGLKRYQSAYFDARVCDPNARSYQNSNLKAMYQKHEQSKRQMHEERIPDVEMGSFTP